MQVAPDNKLGRCNDAVSDRSASKFTYTSTQTRQYHLTVGGVAVVSQGPSGVNKLFGMESHARTRHPKPEVTGRNLKGIVPPARGSAAELLEVVDMSLVTRCRVCCCIVAALLRFRGWLERETRPHGFPDRHQHLRLQPPRRVFCPSCQPCITSLPRKIPHAK